ncbi:hypothetical protein LX36DRAFT_753910 [Colletotrichum falcatum]|nr:hypothetical protein LX36DRAFT_753910 [Colletotrichum falcatum]
MADHEHHGRWHNIAEKIFNRGLFDDILNAPGNIVSQVLSSPATTTQQNNVQAANTPAAAADPSTQAAAAPPPATTPAAAAPAATTPAPAAQQQPAETPAPSPKQQESQQQQQQSTRLPAALVSPSQTRVPAALDDSRLTAAAAAASSSPADPLTTSPPAAAAETAPPTAENAASSHTFLQSASISRTGAPSVEGMVTTKSGATSPTQTPQTPPPDGAASNTDHDQGALVATGVVLGIVLFLGVSLLVFWFLRRMKKRDGRGHAPVQESNPISEHPYDNLFRDYAGPGPMVQHNSESMFGDTIADQHPTPGQLETAQAAHPPPLPGQNGQAAPPFAAQPFSYAQAQQYVQSLADTGTIGFPPPPPIPQPSPIRIFRWPTHSSRSAASSRSALSGLRSHRTQGSGHRSQASRSTISSMLWHGRRDIIARSTTNNTPSLPNTTSAAAAAAPGEGSHTPVLDWLHWIRGHQQIEPDPEMNHRKSFASTTESCVTGHSRTRSASTASSGVFSSRARSGQPLTVTPSVTPEGRIATQGRMVRDAVQYINLRHLERANGPGDAGPGAPGSVPQSAVHPLYRY